MQARARSRAAWVAAGSLLFLAALSWLPYRVPMPHVYSESYVFGYNNRVAVVLTGLWAVLLAIFGPALRLQFGRGRELTTATLHKALAISGGIAGALYLLTRRLEGTEESIYLIDRIKLLLEGQRPYRDFEFAYGPALLYVPAWLTRWLHLPVGDAYGIFWIACVLAGTYLLWKTILWTGLPQSAQRSVFLLAWVFSVLNLSTFGVSYTLLRYVLPCFFGLLVYRRLRRSELAQPWALFLPALLYAVLLMVSQELAIAFAAGVTGFLLRFGRLGRPGNLLAFAAGLVAMGAITFAGAHWGLFYTLRAFSTGGFNLPVTPAPHVLLLLLLTGVCACYAGQRLRSGQPDALLMLIAVSACSLAAAMGRCDPLHVFLNPFGITLAGSLLLLGLPRLRVWAWPAMWLVFAVLFSLTLFLQVGLQIEKAAVPALLSWTPSRERPVVNAWLLRRMTRALGPQTAGQKFAILQAATGHQGGYDVPAIFGLPESTTLEVPFGFAPGGFGTYHSPRLEEGYYFENENVLTPDAVTRKVAELQAHPGRPLLLLPGRENACTVREEKAGFAIREPFWYPYMATPRHANDVTAPLCAYIRDHYRPSAAPAGQTFGYTLWVPR